MKSRTNVKRFLVDWAAVLALLVCFIAFTAVKGSAFMSGSNMVNILKQKMKFYYHFQQHNIF